MGAGMARYARLHAANEGKFSVDTFASFDLYCHYVAGLVGEGLSRLFSASGKEGVELGKQVTLSNSMGLMLQKTNILRDFREDTDEGRVFWPAEIWKKYVDKPEDLHAVGNEEKAMWALSEMTVDALTHATDALDYLTLLSNQSVFNFCAIPQVMAVATLDECFMNPKVMHQNVKIRKGAAVKVSSSSLSLYSSSLTEVGSSSWLRPTPAMSLTSSATTCVESTLEHARTTPRSSNLLSSPVECVLCRPLYSLADQCSQVEQWTESRYPSFIVLGQPLPKSNADWYEGLDARIKQLPPPEQEDPESELAQARAKGLRLESTSMTSDDVSGRFRFEGDQRD